MHAINIFLLSIISHDQPVASCSHHGEQLTLFQTKGFQLGCTYNRHTHYYENRILNINRIYSNILAKNMHFIRSLHIEYFFEYH